MKAVSIVFQKSWGRQFYLENASFFLLIVGLAAGFMREPDHVALAEFFISTPFVMAIPVAVWTCYTIKIIFFNKRTLEKSENEFLYQANLLPPRMLSVQILRVLFMELMPVFAYALFLLLIAAKNQAWTSAIIALLACPILAAWGTFHLYKALHHPNQEKRTSTLSNIFNRSFTRLPVLFFPEWATRTKIVLVLGTKAFSAALLLAVLYLHRSDQYDNRLLMLGTLLAGIGHAQLLSELHRFENFHFVLLRQMPLSFGRRLLYAGVAMLLMLFIEAGLLINYRPQYLSLFTIMLAFVWMFSILVFFYGLLYQKDRDPEKMMSIGFVYGITLFVIVLFKVPVMVLILLNIGAGLFLWRRYYYRFEYTTDPTA